MYIGQQALELPTFAPLSGCSIPEYPEDKIHQAVTGVVDGKIMSCGGNIGSFTVHRQMCKVFLHLVNSNTSVI